MEYGKYRKAIYAFLFLLNGWCVTSLPEGVTDVEWSGLLLVAAGTIAVWDVPNDDYWGQADL